MMTLVLTVVGFMWIVQVIFLERNYIQSAISSTQRQITPVMEDLKIKDLAYEEDLMLYVSQISAGKMLLIGPSGDLVAMYTYGHPVDLEADDTDFQVWRDIQNSEEFANIESGEMYQKEIRSGYQIRAYEIGIPVHYYGKEAYMILHQSFTPLYTVLNMNRNQLIIITIVITVAASIIAYYLSRKFTKPIREIQNTVEKMAKGDLTATTGVTLEDELGQLSDSVEKLGEELQRIDVLRKEVIANVSHELRSPLALIGGYAEMVRDVNWSKEKEREEDLNLIIKEANRMSEMVNDILDYSQLQSGYSQLKLDAYNLYDLICAEVLQCEGTAEENHVHLRIRSEKTDVPVRVDALKMSQVIRNLLYNAINHTTDGETIEINLKETKTAYRVSVTNPGDEIPEEDREIIWERYQRSQHQGGRRQGTGIGLSIVSTILNAHGMTYGVICNDGKTSFWFEYPIEED